MTAIDAPTEAPIVVGVDDSRLGLTAVRLAAREAALRSRMLRIVHSFNWVPDPLVPVDTELRRPAEDLIARALAAATEAQPGITVTSALIEGPVITTMLRESGSAALLVVGDGGLAQHPHVPADVAAVQIAARAGCSVLVVREQPPPAGPVLVGVDGSSSSLSALDFAFDCAARRSAELIVMQIWNPDDSPAGTADAAAERLAAAVSPRRRRYPGVPVEQHVRAGDPESTLVAESTKTELVVVSARGEQPWRGMLGAVSQTVLYHSPAPVVIVRSPHELYVQE